MSEQRGGLHIFRASRLEALVPPLNTICSNVPASQEAILIPQTILVSHAGMRPWLLLELAKVRGPQGIVADVDMSLPSSWYNRLAHKVLGRDAVALDAYSRRNLAWRVFAVLPSLPDEALQAYLNGAGDDARNELRRFQLADCLAGLFSQYMVYRPQWLKVWADGSEFPGVDAGYFPALWQILRREINQPHRGEILAQLTTAIIDGAVPVTGGEDVESVLHVFGAQHMPASELALLKAISLQRPVALYVPDPSNTHWSGLSDEIRTSRRAVEDMTDAELEALEDQLLDLPHPLLAAWGALGQHFFIALENHDPLVDLRDFRDELNVGEVERESVGVTQTRLERLQESVRRNDASLLETQTMDTEDHSLLVHSCHTRLRELEVLRDQLTIAFANDPELKPSDVAVLSPSMADYVGLLPAVFGAPADLRSPLPYHVTDVPLSASHSVFRAFQAVLDWPSSRVRVSDVMNLLDAPEIRQAIGLDVGVLPQVHDCLIRNQVAWGLDGEFKSELGLPEVQSNTLAWGMDRIVAAHLMGPTDGDQIFASDSRRVFDGVLPATSRHMGDGFAWMGGLDRLISVLNQWSASSRASMRLEQWRHVVVQLVADMLRAVPQDKVSEGALKELEHTVIEALASSSSRGEDFEVAYPLIRELIANALESISERQGYLFGAISFCGMIPRRAIPYRFIAVLGLNDDAFPRREKNSFLDLMTQYRALGDRPLSVDDRYMFLETVMSARDRLHLSYVGQSAENGSVRNASLPLSDLLHHFERHPDAMPGWLVKHPLQPFSPRYHLKSEPLLQSYDAPLLATNRSVFANGPDEAPRPFDDVIERVQIDEDVRLDAVSRFYRSPAREILTRGYQLSIVDSVAGADESDLEPMDATVDRRLVMARRVFLNALKNGPSILGAGRSEIPSALRASGLLAEGDLGDEAWSQEVAKAKAAYDKSAAMPFVANDDYSFAEELSVRVSIGGFALDARIPLIATSGHGNEQWVVEADFATALGKKVDTATHFHRFVLPFLRWACLRLASPNSVQVRLALLTAEGNHQYADMISQWDDAICADGDGHQRSVLERSLTALVKFWSANMSAPRLYFSGMSWTLRKGPVDLHDVWFGREPGLGEVDDNPYNRLLIPDIDGLSQEVVQMMTDDAAALVKLMMPPDDVFPEGRV